MNKLSLLIERFLAWWSPQVCRFAWAIIVAAVLVTAVSLKYTIDNLGVNTDTTQMLAADLPFQQNRRRIEEQFPQDANVIIFVVEGNTPEQTTSTANALADNLRQNDNFSGVYIPTDNDFFAQQGLLFLSEDELATLAEHLIAAQPFIGYLAQNYHLQGLFELLGRALNQNDDELPLDVAPLLDAISQSLKQQLDGDANTFSWHNLLAASKPKTNPQRALVIAKPNLDFAAILPANQSLNAARQIATSHRSDAVRIRITGEIALEHEELESVSRGAVVAGIVSLLLVIAALWLGLRSFKLLVVTIFVLITGLLLTAGFATVAIGHLNLISVAFAVLYIGLGVDYAIHICLHYRWCIAAGNTAQQAIAGSLNTVGFSIFLCAITTSMGFLAFIPTDYSGVSELGIISAGGMFIGLAISITLLPAILSLQGSTAPRFNRTTVQPHHGSTLQVLLGKGAGKIRVGAVVMGLVAAGLAGQVVFDANPINLRDPNSESVSTIKELLASPTDSPFVLSVLAESLPAAASLAEALEALEAVHSAVYLDDFLAKGQAAKLEIIDDMGLVFATNARFPDAISTVQPHHGSTMQPKPKQAMQTLNTKLTKILQNPAINNREAIAKLQQTSADFIAHFGEDDAYTIAQQNILRWLPYTMDRLYRSLQASEYNLQQLPSTIKHHWLSPAGWYRVLIMPQHDLNTRHNLKEFVRQVQQISPTAAGLPIADQESGAAIVAAFVQAFSGAVIAIFVLLIIMLRSLTGALQVIGPLLLATLLTAASNVLLGNAFNFANIIALPLLLGMGVDSSIHIMQRLKCGVASQDILQTNTARGVFFSALTTLCSFSSLAFTPHLGTASMGLLLAVGIFWTLVCTLIVLPAFCSKRQQL